MEIARPVVRVGVWTKDRAGFGLFSALANRCIGLRTAYQQFKEK
ncbi:MAG: hypothetical protein AABZ57_01760 [Candidatus Margulisiibacteriota bacterium]